jgi:hypothetical protein
MAAGKEDAHAGPWQESLPGLKLAASNSTLAKV